MITEEQAKVAEHPSGTGRLVMGRRCAVVEGLPSWGVAYQIAAAFPEDQGVAIACPPCGERDAGWTVLILHKSLAGLVTP